MRWLRDLPVAWLQLSHSRSKLLAAVVGIVFADLLMWMQLGFRAAAIDSSLYIHKQLNGELVILNPQTEQVEASKPFPRGQLARARRGELTPSPRPRPRAGRLRQRPRSQPYCRSA